MCRVRAILSHLFTVTAFEGLFSNISFFPFCMKMVFCIYFTVTELTGPLDASDCLQCTIGLDSSRVTHAGRFVRFIIDVSPMNYHLRSASLGLPLILMEGRGMGRQENGKGRRSCYNKRASDASLYWLVRCFPSLYLGMYFFPGHIFWVFLVYNI